MRLRPKRDIARGPKPGDTQFCQKGILPEDQSLVITNPLLQDSIIRGPRHDDTRTPTKGLSPKDNEGESSQWVRLQHDGVSSEGQSLMIQVTSEEVPREDIEEPTPEAEARR